MLVGSFISDFYKLVAEWADWASDLVEQWPDDPRQAIPDVDAFKRAVDRASWSE